MKRVALTVAIVLLAAFAFVGIRAVHHDQSDTRDTQVAAVDPARAESVSKLPNCSGFQESDAATAEGDQPDQPSQEADQPAADSGLTSTDNHFCDEQGALQDGTLARTKAENDTQRTGTATVSKITHSPAPGWAGETLFGNQNDWEPDVAADPGSAYVYTITTEFGNRACGKCPNPAFVYKVSNNNGASWSAPRYLCKCRDMFAGSKYTPGSGWQYDPTIAVDNNGKVYATILAKWHTYVTTSTDHGHTWSPLVDVAPNFSWTDHGQITISPDGQNVYVAFNHADSYVVASHDGGATFSDPVRTNTDENSYWYHYKGTVLNDGTVLVPTAAVSRHPYDQNLTRYYELRSTDGGVTWSTIQVAPAVPEQPFCYTAGCRNDHWGGLTRLASDGNGTVAYSFVGPKKAQDGQEAYVATSTDGGQTFGTATQLSPTYAGSRRVVAAFPQITGVGDSGFGTWWMDDRNAHGRFNVWYSSSNDDGNTWSPGVRISDANSGAGYKNAKGFMGDYGDYGGIATMRNGKVIGIWGEAFGYSGPGNTWINRQI